MQSVVLMIKAFLEGGVAHVPGNKHVGGVEFTVSDHLHFRNGGEFLTGRFKNRTPKITGDALYDRASLSLVASNAWSSRSRREENR